MSLAGPIPLDMSMHNVCFKLTWVAGFLSRLRRDRCGNVLAITAAAMIPLVGLIGGGLDLSRLYLVKTRLQHACDAGALAGRKAMGGGTWAQASYAPRTTANEFFDGNYEDGAYGAENLRRTFTESAGRVTGTAQADVPMTLMRIFDQPTKTLAVDCDAEMRLPNTDVMFVLDVTGSMGSPASPGDPAKITTLKESVKCFYEIVARLDTNATCVGGAPSGGTDPQVQIRFGFMPYNTNVNVGRLLPTAYFADNWSYQSREPVWWIMRAGVDVKTNAAVNTPGVLESTCTSKDLPLTTTITALDTIKTEVAVHVTASWTKTFLLLGTCSSTQTITTRIYDKRTGMAIVPTANDQFYKWHYAQLSHDVSGLKNGTNWNSGMSMRIGSRGTLKTIGWNGCIEERATIKNQTLPGTAKDLDIDLVPTKSDPGSLWGPALGAVVYERAILQDPALGNDDDGTLAESFVVEDNNPANENDQYQSPSSTFCPTAATRLKSWPDATTFDSYVDSLQPSGNTYHDIGMLWGARLMSPTGIFSSENATTPSGGQITRHMIFMTDGDAVAQPCDYTAYGVAWWDRRTTDSVGTKSNCGGYGAGYGPLNDQVNARLDALCTIVKNKNITLWVISFGNGSNAATEKRLKDCASDGRYFSAKSSAALQKTFADIANQISQLRLTK